MPIRCLYLLIILSRKTAHSKVLSAATVPSDLAGLRPSTSERRSPKTPRYHEEPTKAASAAAVPSDLAGLRPSTSERRSPRRHLKAFWSIKGRTEASPPGFLPFPYFRKQVFDVRKQQKTGRNNRSVRPFIFAFKAFVEVVGLEPSLQPFADTLVLVLSIAYFCRRSCSATSKIGILLGYFHISRGFRR